VSSFTSITKALISVSFSETHELPQFLGPNAQAFHVQRLDVRSRRQQYRFLLDVADLKWDAATPSS